MKRNPALFLTAILPSVSPVARADFNGFLQDLNTQAEVDHHARS